MEFDTPLDGWFTHVTWNIDLHTRGPFVRASSRRRDYGQWVLDVARELREEGAFTAHALEVNVIVPVKGRPQYDLALLVHAAEPMERELVERTMALGLPAPELAMTAQNGGRIGDTEQEDGEVLLNHFAGDCSSRATVEAWKSVAEWYARELDVNNSVLLEFARATPFLTMNYAVLPGRTMPFLAGQMLRPSFHRLVRPRLREAGITPFPFIARRLSA